MSEHVVCIVQARLGSSRLSRKALADIDGKPMIVRVVERAAMIAGVHSTIVAIPSTDGELEYALRCAGIAVYQPDGIAEEDVLGRYARAAEATSADIIVRVTGDCPLLDPAGGAALIATVQKQPNSYYTSSIAEDGAVDGMDVEVFRRWILEAADREATDAADREHVTPWIRRHSLRNLPPGRSQWPFKLSVDTAEDLLAVRAVFKQLPPGKMSMGDTLIAAARAGVWDYA